MSAALTVTGRLRVDLRRDPNPGQQLAAVAEYAPPGATVILLVGRGQLVPASAQMITDRPVPLQIEIECDCPDTISRWVRTLTEGPAGWVMPL